MPPVTMVCAQPLARATAAFSSVLTVPIIVTPSARAHWQATRPTPPAAAWYRIVSPPFSGKTWRNRYCAVMPFIISVDALRSPMPSGSGISTSAGITRTSAYAPCGPEQVADAVADPDVGDACAYRLDHADRVTAQPARQAARVAPGAEVDVDEVHRDVGVAHARLAGAGVADLDRFELAATSGPPVS